MAAMCIRSFTTICCEVKEPLRAKNNNKKNNVRSACRPVSVSKNKYSISKWNFFGKGYVIVSEPVSSLEIQLFKRIKPKSEWTGRVDDNAAGPDEAIKKVPVAACSNTTKTKKNKADAADKK